MVLLQMSSRQAKVARVVQVDTPDNSSSESEEEEEQEGGQDIQVGYVTPSRPIALFHFLPPF